MNISSVDAINFFPGIFSASINVLVSVQCNSLIFCEINLKQRIWNREMQ